MSSPQQPRRSSLQDLLEWFSTALCVAGAVLLALKLPSSGWAFVLYLVATVVFTTIFVREKRWSLALLNFVFVLSNLLGIYRWLIAS